MSLSYQVTEYASVGIGGRYWHMQANGSDKESFVGGPSVSLPVDWKTDILGVFVQAGLKFGPIRRYSELKSLPLAHCRRV